MTGAAGRDPETDRLMDVYGAYRTDERRRAGWDPANPGNQLIEAERWAVARRALGAHDLWPIGFRVLDVGCGTGRVLGEMRERGAPARSLAGVDVLADRIAAAAAEHPEISWLRGDGRTLPFASSSQRVVIAYTVFSSILGDDIARRVAREVDRVLEPGGGILWYDFRVSDPRNRNTRAMGIRQVEALFPGYVADLASVTLVPQIARRIRSASLYRRLAAVPLLRTHLGGVLVKP